MKKSLFALAALTAFAGAAQANSSVIIYGAVDVGVIKNKNQTTSVGRGDNNKLGFRGVEDLGGGLSALFHLEMRFDPDTGTTEAAPNRPLFQGQSRVGLKGGFGTIRLGRGLSAVQDSVGSFEPWSFASNRANLVNYVLAGYNGDPQNAGSSQNRFANGVWYNTPVVGGFQANFTLASKERAANPAATVIGNGTPLVTPYSFSTTYNNGPFAAMVGYERNAIETKFWNLAATLKVLPNLKLIGTYAQQKVEIGDLKTKGLTVGAQWTLGKSVVLAGYGRNKPDGISKTDQYSVGYEYHFSKRTFVYADAWNRRAPGVRDFHSFDVGIHHNF